MTPLEYALVAYAKMYLSDARLQINHAPELRPLELKIAELCGDTNWYSDIPPFDDKSVIFFWWEEPEGTSSQCIVDTKSGTVHWYNRRKPR